MADGVNIFTTELGRLRCGRCGSAWVDRDRLAGYWVIKCCRCSNMCSERYMSKWGFTANGHDGQGGHNELEPAPAQPSSVTGDRVAAGGCDGAASPPVLTKSKKGDEMNRHKKCSRPGCDKLAWRKGECYRHATEGKQKKLPEMVMVREIGPRLRELRLALYPNDRRAFARASGLGVGNISNREKKGVSRNMARKIAGALGCREEWLLDGAGRMFPEGSPAPVGGDLAPGVITRLVAPPPILQITEMEYEDYKLAPGGFVAKKVAMRAQVDPGADLDTAWTELVAMVKRKLDDDLDVLEARKADLAREIEQLTIQYDQLYVEVVETSETLAGMKKLAAPAPGKSASSGGAPA